METETMGRVAVAAKVENLQDILNAQSGQTPPPEIRCVEIDEALVDTGTKLLSMPKSLIDKLGLIHLKTAVAKTTNGRRDVRIYSPVMLTIQGRNCPVEVAEIPEDCPVLVGFIALELLNFVVDPGKQELVTDPFLGEEPYLEMF